MHGDTPLAEVLRDEELAGTAADVPGQTAEDPTVPSWWSFFFGSGRETTIVSGPNQAEIDRVLARDEAARQAVDEANAKYVRAGAVDTFVDALKDTVSAPAGIVKDALTRGLDTANQTVKSFAMTVSVVLVATFLVGLLALYAFGKVSRGGV